MEGKKILAAIVSPQPSALKRILEGEGYSVHLASTGAIAESLVRSLQPDAVPLSVDLPDMSGIDVCRAMKSDRRTADIPVIFYTAASSVSRLTTQLAEAAGAAAFLTFGASSQLVLNTIASNLRHKDEGDRLPEKRPA